MNIDLSTQRERDTHTHTHNTTLVSRDVCSWEDFHVDFEAWWKRAKQPNPDTQPNQRGHAAMWNGGGKLHMDQAAWIVNLDLFCKQRITKKKSVCVFVFVSVCVSVSVSMCVCLCVSVCVCCSKERTCWGRTVVSAARSLSRPCVQGWRQATGRGACTLLHTAGSIGSAAQLGRLATHTRVQLQYARTVSHTFAHTFHTHTRSHARGQ